MDKYDFQELLKNYGFGYYQGGGIHFKGKSMGQYIVGQRRVIQKVVTDLPKLKIVCLLHGISTENYS
ncbi:hypothetical protein VPHD520_0098 [Vibrio phage D520]